MNLIEKRLQDTRELVKGLFGEYSLQKIEQSLDWGEWYLFAFLQNAEIDFEVWEGDECVAMTNDYKEALRYREVYAIDGNNVRIIEKLTIREEVK